MMEIWINLIFGYPLMVMSIIIICDKNQLFELVWKYEMKWNECNWIVKWGEMNWRKWKWMENEITNCTLVSFDYCLGLLFCVALLRSFVRVKFTLFDWRNVIFVCLFSWLGFGCVPHAAYMQRQQIAHWKQVLLSLVWVVRARVRADVWVGLWLGWVCGRFAASGSG